MKPDKPRRRRRQSGSRPLLRSILKVGTGAGMAQVIVFAFAPFLTRIYGPDGYGVQGAFLAAISVLAPIAALRYPQAIVIADDEIEARRVERLSIRTAIVVMLVLVVITVVFTRSTAEVLGLVETPWLVYVVPIAVLATAYQEVVDARLVRMELFGAVGRINATQALLVNTMRLLSGLVSPRAGNLIVISAVAPALQAAMGDWVSRRTRRGTPRIEFTWRQTRKLSRKYRDFPLYRMPSDLLYAISEALPVLALTYYFGVGAAGLYALSRTLLMIPSNIVGQAVSSVLYARLASLDRDRQQVAPLLGKSSLLLLGAGSVFVIVVIAAQPAFGVFFGAGWEAAGPMCAWMSIWIACNLANAPATRAANVIRRQGVVLVFNIITLFVRAAALIIPITMGASALTVVASYSIASALRSLALTALLQYYARVYDKTRSAAPRSTEEGNE